MAGFRLLHVGCGEVYRPDAVNVDLCDATVADLLCDAARLPFADATFQEIEANQVLEHLDFAGVTTALAEFYRVLVPNGLLALETPEPKASMRAYLDARDEKERLARLVWIFGDGTPSNGHKLLLEPPLLEELLVETGFTAVKRASPRTYRFEHGYRLLARKRASAFHSALSLFRARRDPRDRSDPLLWAEFENRFVGNLRKIRRRPAPAERRRLWAENVTISARATLLFLDAARSSGLRATGAPEWRKILPALVAERFPGRLFAAFKESTAAEETDAYETVFGEAVSALLDGRWKRFIAGLPEADGEAPFLRERCAALARRTTARGVKAATLGRTAEARAMFERVCRWAIESDYAWWNLATLAGAEGDWPEAVVCYRRGLQTCRPAVVERMSFDAALAALEARDAAAALEFLAPLPQGPQRDTLMAVAFEIGAQPAQADLFARRAGEAALKLLEALRRGARATPAPRVTPVAPGTGVYEV